MVLKASKDFLSIPAYFKF